MITLWLKVYVVALGLARTCALRFVSALACPCVKSLDWSVSVFRLLPKIRIDKNTHLPPTAKSEMA